MPLQTALTGLTAKLTLLTAAIGAGFAAPAHAGFQSTDTSGTQTFTTTSSPLALDLDGNGITDFSLTTDGTDIYLTAAESNKIEEFLGFVYGYSSTDGFTSQSNIKFTANPSSLAFFQENDDNLYAELVFQGANGLDYTGYIEGQYIGSVSAVSVPGSFDPATPYFELVDYGYDPDSGTPVPEPGTMALLAAGAAGLTVLRRRQVPTA